MGIIGKSIIVDGFSIIPPLYPAVKCKCGQRGLYWYNYRTGKIQFKSLGAKSQVPHTKELILCEICAGKLITQKGL